MSPRLPLNIPTLTRVSEFRNSLLFLETKDNRTQLRNTCYLLQLCQMLRNVNNNYNINRGLWYIYLYNFLRISADSCESILYCFKVKNTGKPSTGKVSLEDLVNYAKATHKPVPLLKKSTRLELEKLVYFRNNLHPDSQEKLHIKLMQELDGSEHATLTNTPVHLLNDIREYLDFVNT